MKSVRPTQWGADSAADRAAPRAHIAPLKGLPMNPELQALNQRIEASIRRIPDCLSRYPEGASVRAEFARIFSLCVGGTESHTGMYALLPMHLSLLTDPHLFVVPGGFLVLDHPTRACEHEWWLVGCNGLRVHSTPMWWSLYEDRHPRVIVSPHKGESVHLSAMLNRLTNEGFHGPFGQKPRLEVSRPGTGPVRSLASCA